MVVTPRHKWSFGRRQAPLLHSSAFRLGVSQAATFALIALFLFALTWWAIRQYVRQQVHASIQDEVHEVAGVRESMLPGEVKRLAERSPSGPYFYGYLGAGASHPIGNLAVGRARPGWQRAKVIRLPPVRTGHEMHVPAYALALRDGGLLIVGRDERREDQLDDLLQSAFLSAGAIAVVLALVGGWLAAKRYLDRVDMVSASAARIVEGDLSARIPKTGRSDEFDRLAHTLNGMLGRIQQLMESMRQVSSDIAHDLRTPLAHMRQRLEQAQLRATTVEDCHEAIARAITDVDRVLNTFSALLRIAQIESGQLRASFVRVDLSQLIESLVEDYGPVFEDHDRPLSVSISRGLYCYGDPALLTQMLANLLENILRHTPPGSAAALSLGASHGAALIVLEDEGPGIPPDQRQRVFRRFTRLDTARSSPGAGLGMALVAAVAERHGIVIELDDAQPGLRITLHVPERYP